MVPFRITHKLGLLLDLVFINQIKKLALVLV